MDELERIKDAIDSLRADLTSFIRSYNENNVGVQQGLIATKAWQESHEKIDDDRWARLDEKLAEMRAMMEAIPREIGKDLGNQEIAITELGKKLAEHDAAIERIKTIWLTLTALAGAAVAAAEFFFHLKKG